VKCLDWKLDEWKAYARCKQHTSVNMNIIALCLAHCPIITQMLVATTLKESVTYVEIISNYLLESTL